jgi:hypothetical protein
MKAIKELAAVSVAAGVFIAVAFSLAGLIGLATEVMRQVIWFLVGGAP